MFDLSTERKDGTPISRAYQADYMAFMREVPDKFFDLTIPDPPYFSGPEKRGYYGERISSKGVNRIDYPVIEKWELPTQEFFNELSRISKHQIIWGINYFKVILPSSGRIIWDKVNFGSDYSDCEIAYCSKHNTVRLFRFMWNGMLQGKSIKEGHIQQGNKKLNEVRIHPTQKPVPLYTWLFENYTEPGFKVYDPCLGSGSSRIAAFKYGLDFWSTELNQTHFERQEARFKQAIAEPLFDRVKNDVVQANFFDALDCL